MQKKERNKTFKYTNEQSQISTIGKKLTFTHWTKEHQANMLQTKIQTKPNQPAAAMEAALIPSGWISAHGRGKRINNTVSQANIYVMQQCLDGNDDGNGKFLFK